MKPESPFTPGTPAPLDLFVGREDDISRIVTSLARVHHGRQENIFLSGERGIGKSSLARYIRMIAAKDYNLLTIHVHLGSARTLEEVVRLLFDSLLKETYSQRWFDKIRSLFRDHIREVDLFGVNVTFTPPDEDLIALKLNFAQALMGVFNAIKEEKSGFCIVLDDINGLSKTPEFADWYKSLVDHIATHYDRFPVLFMPIGLPEIRDSLSNHQPSLMRIFRVLNITTLNDSDVRYFFATALSRVHVSIEDPALEMLVRYSGGFPSIMHEIGDAVLHYDGDDHIDPADAMRGITHAAERIGEKYLDPQIYHIMRSPRYHSILNKIGSRFSNPFLKKDVIQILDEGESRVFHNFLSTMKNKGIIIPDPEGGRGSWRFVSDLYLFYIALHGEKQR